MKVMALALESFKVEMLEQLFIQYYRGVLLIGMEGCNRMTDFYKLTKLLYDTFPMKQW